MGQPQRVPSKTELRAYLSNGLTQAQIVEQWHKDSGERVSRSAIGMAILRYELKSERSRNTYPDLLPWTLAEEHKDMMDARMLRAESRLRAGLDLPEKERKYLENWKQRLADEGAVIHYDRNLPGGFRWMLRETQHGDDLIDRSNVPAQPKH